MFICINTHMNYQKIYDSIIERAHNRTLECYKERHHIVPKCLGGTDDNDNLVDLTPEEHYVCHQLLVKMYPSEQGLVYAAQMMCINRNNNRLYGWLKRRYHKVCKSRVGEKNPSHGTMWICNGDESKKVPKDSEIPEGWVKGRDKVRTICVHCENEFLSRKLDGNFRKTCSKECLDKHLANINNSTYRGKRENEFLHLYGIYKNMNKVLKLMGYPGAHSTYYKWAKETLENAGMV